MRNLLGSGRIKTRAFSRTALAAAFVGGLWSVAALGQNTGGRRADRLTSSTGELAETQSSLVRGAGKIGVLIASHGDIDDVQKELESYIKVSFQKNPGIPLPQWSRGILTGPAYSLAVNNIKSQYDIIGATKYRASSEEQKEAIDRALAAQGLNAKTYVGYNFTPPYVEDALAEMIEDGVDTIVVFNKGAQFSYASSGENMEDALKFLNKKKNSNVKVIGYRQYSDDPRFRELMATVLAEDTKKYFGAVPEKQVCLMVASHGLPLWLIEKGDPAIKQMKDAVADIKKRLPQYRIYHGFLNDDFFPGAKWVKPSAMELAPQLEKERCTHILMDGRLSFTSHHRATLFDLNHSVRNFMETPPEPTDTARASYWERPELVLAPNFDGDPKFASLIAELTKEAVAGQGPIVTLQERGKSPLPVGSVGKPGVKPY